MLPTMSVYYLSTHRSHIIDQPIHLGTVCLTRSRLWDGTDIRLQLRGVSVMGKGVPFDMSLMLPFDYPLKCLTYHTIMSCTPMSYKSPLLTQHIN